MGSFPPKHLQDTQKINKHLFFKPNPTCMKPYLLPGDKMCGFPSHQKTANPNSHHRTRDALLMASCVRNRWPEHKRRRAPYRQIDHKSSTWKTPMAKVWETNWGMGENNNFVGIWCGYFWKMRQLIVIFNGVMNGMKKTCISHQELLKKIHRLVSFRQPEELVPANDFYEWVDDGIISHRIHGTGISISTFLIKIKQMQVNIPVPWIRWNTGIPIVWACPTFPAFCGKKK